MFSDEAEDDGDMAGDDGDKAEDDVIRQGMIATRGG
jgi:hypothetical protein